VGGVLEELMNDTKLQLIKPSLNCTIEEKNFFLYMQNPPQLERETRPNLEKPLSEFIKNGDFINITDPGLPGIGIQMQINFE